MFTRTRTQEPRNNPYSEVKENTVSLSATLTGWDLVQKLHSIGLDNPEELARLLEEEDPFKVKINDFGNTGPCVLFTTTSIYSRLDTVLDYLSAVPRALHAEAKLM